MTSHSSRPAAARLQALGWLLLLATGLVAPFLAYPTFLMKVLCFALFASAFNLLLGYAGLLSFGHAAFFGGAAYICAVLSKDFGLDPALAVLAGGGFAALLGLAVGSLAIRRSGIYMTMITLALAQLVFFFAVDVAGFWLIHRTIHSPYGQVLKAIRENEPRAVSLGYDVARYKLLAFVLSAALSGVAGSLKALVFQLASLTDVHWHMSGEVVLMTLLGGLGTLLGPAVGALTIVSLQNELADKVGSWVTVIMGAIFVVCVMVFRRGLVGELLARFRRRPGAASPPAGSH